MGFELGRILVLPLTSWVVLEKLLYICKMERILPWRVVVKNRNYM